MQRQTHESNRGTRHGYFRCQSNIDLIVIADPPGAGKTTVGPVVSGRLSPSVLLQGNVFFQFLDQGAQKPWLPEAQEQNRTVIRASGAAAGQYTRGGFEAVFEGVPGPWFLPTFFRATGLYVVHFAVLLPPVDRCVQNVTTREGNPEDQPGTRLVHEQFERADIGARPLVVDPAGTTPREVAADIVARCRRGDFVYDGQGIA